jgi:UDPglucose 6-dehydrogenase
MMTDTSPAPSTARRLGSKIGWIGLGKLGLPCATVLNVLGGHKITAVDANPDVRHYLENRRVPYREEGLDPLLRRHTIECVDTIREVVAESHTVFIAVQTPHSPEFGGETEFEGTPEDFEYAFLEEAFRHTCLAAQHLQRETLVVIISTVLPGTFDRCLRPHLNQWVHVVYNPFFIAMGTVVADFTRPEFVLMGTDHDTIAAEALADIYDTVHDAPVRHVSIPSAELTKVAYNTFLTMKIVFANNVAEIAEVTGADADEVTDSLAMATDRLLSPRYMRAGMGDGGGCHPRDNIALSRLAEDHRLSFNLAGQMIAARELQSRKLAALVEHWSKISHLSVIIFGKAYKPETALQAGSPAFLLLNQLRGRLALGKLAIFDPFVDENDMLDGTWTPAVYVIATNHEAFHEWKYPYGSVVIDPWGDTTVPEGVVLVRPGRR